MHILMLSHLQKKLFMSWKGIGPKHSGCPLPVLVVQLEEFFENQIPLSQGGLTSGPSAPSRECLPAGWGAGWVVLQGLGFSTTPTSCSWRPPTEGAGWPSPAKLAVLDSAVFCHPDCNLVGSSIVCLTAQSWDLAESESELLIQMFQG